MESQIPEPVIHDFLCQCCIKCMSSKLKNLKEQMSKFDEFDACFVYEEYTSVLESRVRALEKTIDDDKIHKEVLIEKVRSMERERTKFLEEIERLKVIIEALQPQEEDPK